MESKPNILAAARNKAIFTFRFYRLERQELYVLLKQQKQPFCV